MPRVPGAEQSDVQENVVRGETRRAREEEMNKGVGLFMGRQIPVAAH
jgi:hypothetical protein